MMDEELSFRPLQAGVEILEAYLPLGASPQEKRLMRQSMGKMIADKIRDLDAYEMVPGPPGEPWVLRCRLVIHFSGVAAVKPKKEE